MGTWISCDNADDHLDLGIFRWESQGYFKPNFDQGGSPFVIPMPPPNVTGSLHMGHAMFVTLEVVESILRIIHSHLGILIYVPIFV